MLRALLALAFTTVSALAQDAPAARRIAGEAETALAAQDWKAAVERAKAAISADIDCLPAYITLGRGWEGQGEWYEAALAYDSGYGAYLTRGTDEDMRRLLDLRARATERCGPRILAAGERALADRDLANAESAAQQAIALPDIATEGKILLGRVHHAAGKFEQAVELFAGLIEDVESSLKLQLITQAEADALKAPVQPLLDAARREGVAALLASARAAFERKDYAATIDACDRVHALDDDEPESWLLAGRVHLAAQEWAEAVDALRSARHRARDREAVQPILEQAVAGRIASFPSLVAAEQAEEDRERQRIELRIEEAGLRELLGQHDAALAIYAEELRRYPIGGYAQWLRGARADLHMARHEPALAIADLRACLNLAERPTEGGLFALVEAVRALGGAAADAELTLAIDQLGAMLSGYQAAILLRERANLRVAAGRRDEALADYDAAFRLWKQDADLLRERFALLVALGRPDTEPESVKAILPADPALALARGAEALRVLSAANDRAGLLAVGDAILKAAPDSALGHWMRALALDDAYAAIEAAERALRLGWDAAEAHAELAVLRAKAHQFDRACLDMDAATPGSPRLRAVIPEMRDLVQETNLSLDIVRWFETLVRALPDSAEARMLLGAARWNRQSASEALLDLERATQIDPTFREAHAVCARARMAILEMEKDRLLETDGGGAQVKALCDRAIADFERAGPAVADELAAARERRRALDAPRYRGADVAGARKALADARKLAPDGPAEEIVRLCDQAVSVSPSIGKPDSVESEARLLRAAQYVRLGRYAAALDECCDVWLRDEDPAVDAAAEQQMKDAFRIGERALEAALRASTQEVATLLERARLHARAADKSYIVRDASPEIALQHAQALLRAAPDLAEAHLLCGKQEAALHRNVLACQHYDRAAELGSQDWQVAMYQRGMHSALGDVDWMIADHTRTLRTSPTDVRALLLRAELHMTKLDGASARADLQRALELDPDSAPPLLLRAAGLLTDPAAAAAALAEADRDLEQVPDDVQALTLRTWALYGTGDFAGCVEAWKRLPEERGTTRMVASLAYEAGLRADLPFAVSVAERMILKGLEGMVSAYLRVDGMTRERAIEELYPGVCDLFWIRRRLVAAEGLGDWDRALRAADLLHSVVRGTDEEPAAARRLAVALAHAGRIQDAHALVTGNGANDLVTRSEIERAAHRLEPALALAQSAVAAAPDAAAPHAQQGRILLQLRRFEEAKTSFQRALALDARCAGALRGLGWLSLTVDPARADAEDFFTRAIALEPASGDARIGRYLACAARGIEARAAADFRISFGVTHADSLSDPRPPREKLATTMTLVGQGTRAIECLTEWLDLDPSAAAELLPRRAFLYDRRGRRDDVGDDHDRAESDVRTALALKPNDATFHYWAGVLFRDRAEKLAAFARCIELEPDNAQASVGRAWALASSGERADLEAAERSVRRVFETEPACLAAYWVGIDVSDRLGDYDGALWWFERARRYDPGFPRPDLSRSLALKYEREEQRRRDEAERAAREAEEAERARLAAENGAREDSFEDEYMRQLREWKPDDSLTRMNQEFWASRGSWGTNYHDYQGEAQVRALDRALSRYGPR